MSNDTPTQSPIPSAGAEEFERRLAAFVGPRWEKSYRRKLRPFLSDTSFQPTWNWSAGLATPFWFLYRKMYWWFLVFFLGPQLVINWMVPGFSEPTPAELLLPENEQAQLVLFAVQAAVHLAAGGAGNWLLFRRASTAIRVVAAQPMSTPDALHLLQRVGGVSRGLTFGLVAVMVVLSLSAAMAALAG